MEIKIPPPLGTEKPDGTGVVVQDFPIVSAEGKKLTSRMICKYSSLKRKMSGQFHSFRMKCNLQPKIELSGLTTFGKLCFSGEMTAVAKINRQEGFFGMI